MVKFREGQRVKGLQDWGNLKKGLLGTIKDPDVAGYDELAITVALDNGKLVDVFAKRVAPLFTEGMKVRGVYSGNELTLGKRDPDRKNAWLVVGSDWVYEGQVEPLNLNEGGSNMAVDCDGNELKVGDEVETALIVNGACSSKIPQGSKGKIVRFEPNYAWVNMFDEKFNRTTKEGLRCLDIYSCELKLINPKTKTKGAKKMNNITASAPTILTGGSFEVIDGVINITCNADTPTNGSSGSTFRGAMGKDETIPQAYKRIASGKPLPEPKKTPKKKATAKKAVAKKKVGKKK